MNAPETWEMILQEEAGQMFVFIEEPRSKPEPYRWVGVYESRVDACNHLARIGLLSPDAANTLLSADLGGRQLWLPAYIRDPKNTLRTFPAARITGWQ